jgi:hypothetical protein
MRSCDGSWWRGGCFLDPLPLAGHDLVGLAHQLGHGQLARTVAAGLEPLDDPDGELDVAAVELGLGPSKGGDVLGPGVLAEEQLEQAEAAELGRLVGRLGQPFGERGPALGRDPVAAPPPPGLLALLGQEPEAGQPFGLGVDLAVRELPEMGDAPADPAATGRALAAELARLSVPDPAVEVHRVDRLERQPTGKVRRFRPLTGAVEMAR